MNYSIIIPVFNKSAFTKRCLDTLRPTLEGAGEGEVIVVDNASTDETQELLKNYPWITLIRNEKNLGFAGANNQAARVARGKYLVLLNNDTEAFPGWLAAMLKTAQEPGVGIVGAKLLFPDRTLQHAGVVFSRAMLSRTSLSPFHHNYLIPWNDAEASQPADFQCVTGACLLTPRELYLELGGLDEAYWNGYEDVDYCLKVRAKGLRIAYEPGAMLYHFESQSGVQRFRKSSWNMEVLEERWRGQVRFDAVERNFKRNTTRRAIRLPRGSGTWFVGDLPAVTVVVHGDEPGDGRGAFERQLRDSRVPISKIVWSTGSQSIDDARAAMELRGHRGVAFVHGSCRLEQGWLEELLARCEATVNALAATYAPELPIADNARPVAADARCTLIMLDALPQHVRLEPFDTLNGSVADLLVRAIAMNRGTVGVSRAIGSVPALLDDASFARKHGFPLKAALADDAERIEAILRAQQPRERGLVSIVTLSWNAPQFTKLALESIKMYTSEPYEVIVVDNGSGPETTSFLASLDDPHVRVIYNGENKGFGGGNNIGMAAARGEYVIVLNNDVVVTERWVEGLLEPFTRMPDIGVTAPRSNKIVGPQLVVDASYEGMQGIQAFARERRQAWAQMGFTTERAIGFCLCIDRRVIDEVGGFDERYRMGNFEDDDLCIRVRAAGYKIYVCDDVFIHHFGSQSFAANNVDYSAIMNENAKKFAAKWSYTLDELNTGYNGRRASIRGFDREKHFSPLPLAPAQGEPSRPAAAVAFMLPVGGERDWQDASEFVRRFARAFKASDDVVLAIAALDETLPAESVGARVERLLQRMNIDAGDAPDIEISDEESVEAWRSSIAGEHVDVATLDERSPSSLRRFLKAQAAV